MRYGGKALGTSEGRQARFKKPTRTPRGPCSIEGCDRGGIITANAKLVCNRHYQMWRSHGTFSPQLYSPSRMCTCSYCGTPYDKGYAVSSSRKNDTYCSKECRAKASENAAIEREHDRFWKFVKKSGPNECWIWTGQTNSRGYGCFNPASGGSQIASRISLEMHLGRRLHQGHMACHHCDNPPCVNPEHLYEGTALDNMRDYHTRGKFKKKGISHAV